MLVAAGFSDNREPSGARHEVETPVNEWAAPLDVAARQASAEALAVGRVVLSPGKDVGSVLEELISPANDETGDRIAPIIEKPHGDRAADLQRMPSARYSNMRCT